VNIQGCAILVTGGASGLGLATVQRLAAAGARVVLADLPTSEGAVVARHLPGSVQFAPADVSSESDVVDAVAMATDLGELVAVVNCAGIGSGARVVGADAPHPLDAFRRVLDINLVGTFNVIRIAAAAMAGTPTAAEERGVIVNTASVAAFDGQIGQAAYSASKAGIVGMTLPIARELARHKIRVCTIAPGMFMTPLFRSLGEEQIQALTSQVPHPARLGDPAEFAGLVAHIIENPMLNGETIRLDGAIRMTPK
jgi:NAD(P)-dependent dehydrogenase (short-subunit alcohol dehydrogenase family)